MISSPRNRRVVEAARLHRARARSESGLTLLEGPHLLAEASGVRISLVFGLAEDRESAARAGELGAEWVPVTERVLERIAPTEHPRGPVAVMEIPVEQPVGDRPLLVLWDVGDPGNTGTLIRTGAAFGFGVVAAGSTADPWSPKVLRAGAGGHFRAPVSRRPDLSVSDLRRAGYRLVASVVRGGRSLWEADLGGLVAILVGDEARGLPAEVIDQADVRVTVPMPGGTESLNASVAGALVAHEAVRQSRERPETPARGGDDIH